MRVVLLIRAWLRANAGIIGCGVVVVAWASLVQRNWHWVGALPVVAVLYISILALEAYYRVKDAPKTDAFVCDRHGLIPKKAAFRVVDEPLEYATPEGDSRYGPILYCPICLEDKIKQAKSV